MVGLYEVPSNQLLLLKEELHARIENKEYSAHQIYFITSQLIDGKWNECSMFVDQWPDFNVVVARPLPEEKLVLFFSRRWHFVYTRDCHILEEVLSTPGFINWELEPRFYCLSMAFKDSVSAVCQKFGGRLDTLSTTDEFHFYKDIDDIKIEIPDGFSLDCLDQSMATMAASEWKYADQEYEGAEDFIKYLVNAFPSSCLKNERGEVVAYMLMYYFGVIGMLYVKPKYRRQGYGKIISLDMLKKTKELGFLGIIDVDLDNDASHNLYTKKLNCEMVQVTTWNFFTKNQFEFGCNKVSSYLI